MYVEQFLHDTFKKIKTITVIEIIFKKFDFFVNSDYVLSYEKQFNENKRIIKFIFYILIFIIYNICLILFKFAINARLSNLIINPTSFSHPNFKCNQLFIINTILRSQNQINVMSNYNISLKVNNIFSSKSSLRYNWFFIPTYFLL
jgi:hypothetical protein